MPNIYAPVLAAQASGLDERTGDDAPVETSVGVHKMKDESALVGD